MPKPTKPTDRITDDDAYPLKGHRRFDLSGDEAYALTPDARVEYVADLLVALHAEETAGRLRLKKVPKFRDEMRELRRLVRWRTDTRLGLDEHRWQRNVLMRPSPAHSTHSTHAAEAMVRMGTSFGHLPTKLKEAAAWATKHRTPTHPLTDQFYREQRAAKAVPELFTRIYRLLDTDDEVKAAYRNYTRHALRDIYGHLLQHYNLRSAFPPFHARFLVDYYAPKTGYVVVLDPCAGWGGRLLGSLTIPRQGKVTYVGVDPNRDNQFAYERLTHRVTHYLRKEPDLGERAAGVAPLPFEDWLTTQAAKRLRGTVDVAITSPPYGIATEIYQLEDGIPQKQKTQSANRYTNYAAWIDGFLRPMCDGVAEMLKPNGVFVLNIANVKDKAPRLEDHTNALLKDAGLVRDTDLWKLAMARAVGTQALDPKHSVVVDGVPYRYEPVFVWRKPEGWKPRKGKGIVIRAPKKRKVQKTKATRAAALNASDGRVRVAIARLRSRSRYEKPLEDNSAMDSFYELLRRFIAQHTEYQFSYYNFAFGDVPRRDASALADAEHIIIPSEAEFTYHIPNRFHSNAMRKSQAAVKALRPVVRGKSIVLLRSDRADDETLYRTRTFPRLPFRGFSEIDEDEFPLGIHGMRFHFIRERFGAPSLTRRRHDFVYWGSDKRREAGGAASGDDRHLTLRQIDRDTRLRSLFIGYNSGIAADHKWVTSSALMPLLMTGRATACWNWKSSTAVTARYVEAVACGVVPFVWHNYDTTNRLGATDWQRVRSCEELRERVLSLRDDAEYQRRFRAIQRSVLKALPSQDDYYAAFEQKLVAALRGSSKPTPRASVVVPAPRAEADYIAPDGTGYSREQLAALVKSWRVSPLPLVQKYGRVEVVRDDVLPYGAKMRCLQALIQAHPDIDEFVCGSISKTGLGGVALAHACQPYGKTCVLFLAKRSLSALTPHQREMRALGAVIKWVPNGMLNVTTARAREYATKSAKRLFLPLGLEHPVVVAAMMKTAQSLNLNPKVVVSSGSSGTLNRALQLAFPKARVLMVPSGHQPDARQRGRAELVASPFRTRVPDDKLPPFPSVPTWDAMAWVVAQQHAPCLFWNIGTDERFGDAL